MAQHSGNEPRELLAGMRTEIYNNMLEESQALQDNQRPHTIGFLRVARERFCRIILATMSSRWEALHVLRSLDIEYSLYEVLTREDAENFKPDPEIYCGPHRNSEPNLWTVWCWKTLPMESRPESPRV